MTRAYLGRRCSASVNGWQSTVRSSLLVLKVCNTGCYRSSIALAYSRRTTQSSSCTTLLPHMYQVETEEAEALKLKGVLDHEGTASLDAGFI